MNDEKNRQAYMDVLDCLGPRYPDDEEYMECYRFWRPLQRFPGDGDMYYE